MCFVVCLHNLFVFVSWASCDIGYDGATKIYVCSSNAEWEPKTQDDPIVCTSNKFFVIIFFFCPLLSDKWQQTSNSSPE